MFKGTIYLTGSRIVFIITGFLLNAMLGRWLGPEQFGIFGIINAVLTVFEVTIAASIARGVSKFVAENEASPRTVINGAFIIQAVSGIFIFAAVFFGADLIADLLQDHGLSGYFRMLAFLIPVTGLAIVYESSLNGIRAFGRQAVLILVFHISRLVWVLSFVVMGLAVKGAILGLIVAEITRLFVGRYFCRELGGKGSIGPMKLLEFGVQMGALSFTYVILMNIDLMAVKVILKESSLTGFYNAALTISKMPSFLMGALSATLFPSIVRSISENDRVLTEKYINQTMKYLLMIIMPLTFLISATTEGLIFFVYGSDYVPSAQPLSILIFGWAFLAISTVFNTIILATDKPYVAALIGLLLIPVSILLNLVLIQRMGINGAAWAATVTNVVGCALAGGYVYLCFNTLVKFASVARILLSSIVIYFLAILYPVSGALLLGKYFFLFPVFFILLFVFGEITIDDIINLKSSVFKILKKEKAVA